MDDARQQLLYRIMNLSDEQKIRVLAWLEDQANQDNHSTSEFDIQEDE